MFDRKANYKYSCSRIIVMKLDNGEDVYDGVTYIKGNIGCQIRDTHCEVDIDAGTYAVYVEVDWEKTCYKDCNYVINRYGPGCDGFEDVTESYERSQIL